LANLTKFKRWAYCLKKTQPFLLMFWCS
jgi:hypothetical protein